MTQPISKLHEEVSAKIPALKAVHLAHAEKSDKTTCNFELGLSEYDVTTPATPLIQAYQCGFFYA
jgi:hypothetical protein